MEDTFKSTGDTKAIFLQKDHLKSIDSQMQPLEVPQKGSPAASKLPSVISKGSKEISMPHLETSRPSPQISKLSSEIQKSIPTSTSPTAAHLEDAGHQLKPTIRSTTAIHRKKVLQTQGEKGTFDGPEARGDNPDALKEDFQANMKELMSAPRLRTHGKAKSKVIMMFMPTYRLEPSQPFKVDKAERLMELVLENALSEPYDELTSPVVAQALAKTCLNHVKMPKYNSERYKLACQVRIVEKKFQGYYEKITAIWMHNLDRVMIASVESHTLIATAVLTAIYFD